MAGIGVTGGGRLGTGLRTRAVVVGVERYEGGRTWSLDGPVNDALGFARLLLERGLDPGALDLLLSPLPHNAERVERSGLPIRAADRESVHRVLFRELRAQAAAADFLLVSWSGHGLVDAAGHRRLLYADALADDLRALDVDAALAAYRSDLLPSFARQLWLIDACQIFSDARTAGALQPDPVPSGRARSRAGQHAVFACGPGETARNGATVRAGTFSTEALALLRDGPLPPEAERLTAVLRDRFRTLAAEGTVRQSPTYFWHSGPEGQGEVHSGSTADSGDRFADRRTDQDVEGRTDRATSSATGHGAAAGRPGGLDGRKRLVLALEAVPTMADPGSRAVVLGQLPPEIASSVPRSPITRVDLLAVVETCLAFPDGLTRLRDALGMVDSGTTALAEFDEVMATFTG